MAAAPQSHDDNRHYSREEVDTDTWYRESTHNSRNPSSSFNVASIRTEPSGFKVTGPDAVYSMPCEDDQEGGIYANFDENAHVVQTQTVPMAA